MKNDEVSFENALAEAQKLGFAEQNPTDDIEGYDACRKIAILSSLATGEYIDYRKIYTEGIKNITYRDIHYADRLGYKIKLLAVFKNYSDNLYEAFVAPVLLAAENPLNVANGVYNAILIEGNAVGLSMFYGKGAGKMATASAVVADVIEAILHIGLKPHTTLWETTSKMKIRNHEDNFVKALIRLKDVDESTEIINKLEMITEISFVNKEFEDEIAIIAGNDKTLTEKQLSDYVLNSDNCISIIRIL